MKDISSQVYTITQRIPKGRVATYGQIATLLGDKNMCRAVGNVLHKNPLPFLRRAEEYSADELAKLIPCHRVVNSSGYMGSNFGLNGPTHQAEMLRAEGVEVVNGKVDLSKYQAEL